MTLRHRRLFGVLVVGFGLIVLSALVSSPVTDALPNLFAGGVVLFVASRIVRAFGFERTLSTATAVALGVGGIIAVYEGLSTLTGTAPLPSVALAGEVALLVGLGLFVYDRQFVR